MAEVSNKGSENKKSEVPASKPVWWFVVLVLLVACGGYFVGGRMRSAASRHESGQVVAKAPPQKKLTHRQAGDEALAQKRYDQAVSEYRLTLQDANTAEGQERLAQALLKQGKAEEAFAEFQETLRLDPSRASAASSWGLALAAEGKLDEAKSVLQDALKRNPDAGLLHFNLAATLLQIRVDAQGRSRMATAAGKTEAALAAETEAKALANEALQHFAKADHSHFDSSSFWSGYGQLRNELGQYVEAESCLVRAVAEDSGLATAHFQLALAEDHLGKYAEAIEHYEKALQLIPNDPNTLNNLALLYASATNLEVRTPKMAVLLATRACDATTDQNARYMDTLALSYAADGDLFQAITWEDKAIHRATQLGNQELARELQEHEALFAGDKPQ